MKMRKKCIRISTYWHKISIIFASYVVLGPIRNVIIKIYKKVLCFLTICAKISFAGKQVSARQTRSLVTERHEIDMSEAAKYYVVTQKAVPDVLLRVVEAKRLLESEKVPTVQEAVDAVGISRSSFYKYKDDIFQFHDSIQGTTVTLTFQMEDEPGLLSDVLKIIAEYGANILTIHQSIPISGMASLSLSVQVLQNTGDISKMLEQMESQKGVHHVKILARE